MRHAKEILHPTHLGKLRGIYRFALRQTDEHQDHPGYQAVAAHLRAQLQAVDRESYELMHHTGVFAQLDWELAERNGSVADLYELMVRRSHLRRVL